VATLASTFGLSQSNSRAAVILYSDHASVEIDFDSYGNFTDFRTQVEFLFHQRGRTRIDRALQLAYDRLFGPSGSARRGVHRIVVLLTDGQHTLDPDYIPLEKGASLLRSEGVFIFAVGIGSYVSREELRRLVEKDSHVIMASSFDSLLGKAGAFSKTACDGKCLTK